MRLLQITIPAKNRDRLLSSLEEADINYFLADETSDRDYTAIAYIALPLNAVEPVLERLRDAGLSDDALVVVLEPNSIVSREFDELEEKYARDRNEDRVARSELRSTAAELAPSWRPYVIMTIVSAVIATAGLLLDSSAVVVGSMVIAPVIGPAMSASVGSVMNDEKLFTRGVQLQAVGIGLSVLSALLFAIAVRHIQLVPPLADVTAIPEIEERIAPDFLTLPIALGAGVAGAVSITSGAATALVGVMIAVALLPPAAAVGIALAWGHPVGAALSAALLLVNLLSINLGAMTVMWLKQYRPIDDGVLSQTRRQTFKRAVLLSVGVLVLSGVLAGVTVDTLQTAETREQIETDVDEAILAVDAEGVEVMDIEIVYPSSVPFQEPERIIVTVGIPPGDAPPELGTEIQNRVTETTGGGVETEIRYIQRERR